MSEISETFERLAASKLRLRNTTGAERAAKLKALWAATQARTEDLFKATHGERGTHDLDVAAELMMVKSEIDFVAKHVTKWMKPEKVRNSLATMGKKCEIRRQSKGVVLNIAAYNAPTAESIVPAIAAIAAGNAVIVKTSEYAPASSKIIKEIFAEALSDDDAAVFEGGVEVAQELLALPFDHIYYTGGTAVGKIVMKAAADNLASVTLEMGGKSPVIIDHTADLENAATKLAWGRVMNAGQVCIGPEYVLVHESVKDEFTRLIGEKISALYDSDGKGLDKSPYVPRIINDRHHARIAGLIEDAKAKGATVTFGGRVDASDRFIEPTVLTDMSEDMDIMQEEVFGPVLSIIGWVDRKEVLASIEKRPNPLALYIYSTDKEATEFFLENTSSGSAVVNNNCIQSGTNPRLPFGGVGTSGMGRVGGFEGFRTMSNERSVVHQPLDRLRDMLIMLPPYSARYEKMIMKGIS